MRPPIGSTRPPQGDIAGSWRWSLRTWEMPGHARTTIAVAMAMPARRDRPSVGPSGTLEQSGCPSRSNKRRGLEAEIDSRRADVGRSRRIDFRHNTFAQVHSDRHLGPFARACGTDASIVSSPPDLGPTARPVMSAWEPMSSASTFADSGTWRSRIVCPGCPRWDRRRSDGLDVVWPFRTGCWAFHRALRTRLGRSRASGWLAHALPSRVVAVARGEAGPRRSGMLPVPSDYRGNVL